MEGTAVAILGTLAFCVAGCADIWQFEDPRAASDAPSPEAVAILDDAGSGEAASHGDDAARGEAPSNGSPAVLTAAPAPNPAEAAVDLVPDAASDASCPTCTTSAPAIMCQGPKSACSGQCVDTKNDTKNCGGCGVVCASGEVCHKGTCTAD